MELNREQIKYIVAKDIAISSPMWALLILTMWGIITYLMFWVLLNVVKPSIDRRFEERNRTQVGLLKERVTNLGGQSLWILRAIQRTV